MKKLRILVSTVFVVVTLPSIGTAGGTGACIAFGNDVPTLPQFPSGKGEFAAICIDGLTEQQCASFFGKFDEGPWDEDLTCDEAGGKIPWDGSCLADVGDPIGTACVYLYFEGDPDESEAICHINDGDWFDDPAACGIPTPTMPGFGMAALALLMLGGALILLTMKGSAKTA